jgi:hypothetical protein
MAQIDTNVEEHPVLGFITAEVGLDGDRFAPADARKSLRLCAFA